MSKSLQELIDKFQDQEELYSLEGRRGLTNLIRIVRALGYKDPNYFGQIDQNASIGDLVEFLEDNSGAIEAIIDWIGSINSTDWKDAIEEQLEENDEDDEVVDDEEE